MVHLSADDTFASVGGALCHRFPPAAEFLGAVVAKPTFGALTTALQRGSAVG